MSANRQDDPTKAPRLAPDPDALVISSLGELDGVPEGTIVQVKMAGPVTPPFDELGGVLDRAYRVSLKTHEVKTDGEVRSVSKAARAIAAELGYHHIGHPYAGRHQPDARIQKIDRDIRLEGHLRALKLAGLSEDDIQAIHDALGLPPRDEVLERMADDIDQHNEAASLANLSGRTEDGVSWQIKGGLGFHWPVFRLVATLPDGREVTGRMDLRNYVEAELSRLVGEKEGEAKACQINGCGCSGKAHG